MNGIYNEIYNLISNLLFAGSLDPYEDLICILVSSFAVLFMISIPFILVFKVIKMLVD